MLIDTETYKLTDNNFIKEEYKKTQVVIGHNGRKDMRHIEGWLRRRGGKSKNTAHFTINKEGKIFQHFDTKYYSDLLDVEQDKSNISIMLVNSGWLRLDNITKIFTDWLGHAYSKKTSMTRRSWRGHEYWVNYTDKQMKSLKKLVIQLCDEHNIPKECIGNNVYNENIDIYRGVAFRSNYSQEIKDISPAFDMDVLKEL
jgi:N-acetyl-anhydromuramyl-L-alanine amidase AmpD